MTIKKTFLSIFNHILSIDFMRKSDILDESK